MAGVQSIAPEMTSHGTRNTGRVAIICETQRAGFGAHKTGPARGPSIARRTNGMGGPP